MAVYSQGGVFKCEGGKHPLGDVDKTVPNRILQRQIKSTLFCEDNRRQLYASMGGAMRG